MLHASCLAGRLGRSQLLVKLRRQNSGFCIVAARSR